MVVQQLKMNVVYAKGSGQSECWDGSSVCDAADCPAQTSTVDILYNSDTDIAGFQFNVTGATVSGASGGAAADAGFTVSASATVVLGFFILRSSYSSRQWCSNNSNC